MIGQQVVEDAIRDIGGIVPLQDIYNWFETHAAGLTEWELGRSPHAGRPRYQHGGRSHISNQVQDGKVERVGRALYSSKLNGKEVPTGLDGH